jgi:DNA repair protein RecN (Recombination protein N)
MLTHLRATNFAILSDVELSLGDGLNVLTGETGAGKSLIVEAVNLLRGGRASADIPRTGADEAVVEAVVDVPAELRARVNAVIEEAGLPGDDHVFVRRVIQRGGRSRCYVNGALTTASRLGELGALLVDLSSQHQHQGLVDPARHRHVVDAFGVDPGVLEAMAVAWAELRRCEQALEALATAGSDDPDYLRFQLDELDAAAIAPGEDVALAAERARLSAVEALRAAARGAEERIDQERGDASARDLLAAAARELERVARFDPALAELARRTSELVALADDIAGELRSYADRLDGDPARLAAVDDRVALIRRIARKHGVAGADELAAKASELRGALDELTSRAARAAELAGDRDRAASVAKTAAAALAQKRAAAARALEKQVGAALAELGMAGARLRVAIDPAPLCEHGADRVELLLAANKGEDARPLAKIASGGELSRIMLATKLALRRADPVATYVFDEVDAGIGGQTAQVVARQIRAIADGRQVLCVTHLPQIAAHADHHFHVDKLERGGRTETRVRELTGAARTDELARMLGGQATSRARAHAAELLASTKKRAS